MIMRWLLIVLSVSLSLPALAEAQCANGSCAAGRTRFAAPAAYRYQMRPYAPPAYFYPPQTIAAPPAVAPAYQRPPAGYHYELVPDRPATIQVPGPQAEAQGPGRCPYAGCGCGCPRRGCRCSGVET